MNDQFNMFMRSSDRKFTTSSHARRKRDQASFHIVSLYGHSRQG